MHSQLGGSSDAYACSRESGEFAGRMQCDHECDRGIGRGTMQVVFVRVGALCAVNVNESTGESCTAPLAAVITAP